MTRAAARWIPSNTGDVLVVPLRSDPRPVGILVLARAGSPYGYDDVEMADVLGTFIGRLATSMATVSSRTGDAADPARELETEVELAERS